MKSNKKIRAKILMKRARLSDEEILEGSNRIANILEIIINRSGTKDILCFYPLDKEVNLLGLYEKLLSKGHNLFFPVSGEEEIDFYKINNLNDFEKGKFNVYEPIGRENKFLDKEAIVICPGLAFDRKNNRIGYGKGYYEIIFPQPCVTLRGGLCGHLFFLCNSLSISPLAVELNLLILSYL